MFKDATEAERAERDQDADYARIDAAIDAAETAIAALEGRQLSPDERGKEWFALRDRTILAIRNVRHNIIKRANEAKLTERWMVEKWLREVNDGSILREFAADLSNRIQLRPPFASNNDPLSACKCAALTEPRPAPRSPT